MMHNLHNPHFQGCEKAVQGWALSPPHPPSLGGAGGCAPLLSSKPKAVRKVVRVETRTSIMTFARLASVWLTGGRPIVCSFQALDRWPRNKIINCYFSAVQRKFERKARKSLPVPLRRPRTT